MKSLEGRLYNGLKWLIFNTTPGGEIGAKPFGCLQIVSLTNNINVDKDISPHNLIDFVFWGMQDWRIARSHEGGCPYRGPHGRGQTSRGPKRTIADTQMQNARTCA